MATTGGIVSTMNSENASVSTLTWTPFVLEKLTVVAMLPARPDPKIVMLVSAVVAEIDEGETLVISAKAAVVSRQRSIPRNTNLAERIKKIMPLPGSGVFLPKGERS